MECAAGCVAGLVPGGDPVDGAAAGVTDGGSLRVDGTAGASADVGPRVLAAGAGSPSCACQPLSICKSPDRPRV